MRTVTKTCPVCGKQNSIEMNDEQYNKYISNSDNIQNIFPELSSDKREILITGICGDCWDKVFPKDEEE